ncbi:hypothetical protein [Nocardia africana]
MSSGQLARARKNFPAMNDRASRRRVRRTLARANRLAEQVLRAYEAGIISTAQYRAELGIESPYSRGGYIPAAGPIRVALALDECVLTLDERCMRTDPGHLATDQHKRWRMLYDWYGAEPIELTFPVPDPTDISPTGLWWLSFVDDTKSRPYAEQVAGAGGFLGVCIVQADHFMAAITLSHKLGCNPGGQVKGYPTDAPPHPAWMNRLLTATDIDHIDAIEAGDNAAQTAERLGRGLWERR